jgi:hypothetical protein
MPVAVKSTGSPHWWRCLPMAESIIEYACRVQDKRNGYNITIEALVILAESDMTQKARQKMIAEWRRLRLL